MEGECTEVVTVLPLGSCQPVAGACLRCGASRASDLLVRMLIAINRSFRDLYLGAPRPWMVCLRGGKDSSLVEHLIFEAVRSIPTGERTKEIHLLRTDTRVQIPAVVEPIAGTPSKMQRLGQRKGPPPDRYADSPPSERLEPGMGPQKRHASVLRFLRVLYVPIFSACGEPYYSP